MEILGWFGVFEHSFDTTEQVGTLVSVKEH